MRGGGRAPRQAPVACCLAHPPHPHLPSPWDTGGQQSQSHVQQRSSQDRSQLTHVHSSRHGTPTSVPQRSSTFGSPIPVLLTTPAGLLTGQWGQHITRICRNLCTDRAWHAACASARRDAAGRGGSSTAPEGVGEVRPVLLQERDQAHRERLVVLQQAQLGRHAPRVRRRQHVRVGVDHALRRGLRSACDAATTAFRTAEGIPESSRGRASTQDGLHSQQRQDCRDDAPSRPINPCTGCR